MEKYDLSHVKMAAVRAGVDPELIDWLEFELKRFLLLPLLHEVDVSSRAPSYLVDELWHHFILHTAKYRHFCDVMYGKYLDHLPGAGYNERLTLTGPDNVHYTIEVLKRNFASFTHELWIGRERCGPCWAMHRRG